MMAPGTGFYSDSSLGKNQVRLAYVLNNQDLKKALKLLEEALEEYNNLTK
jgi:aspartate aminotransferase